MRVCPVCGTQHHPRTDPVVIMLVTDGDRALLGRQAQWPAGRYSALAGFVEPGESLEEAVAREVREEAGVRVADVRYRSSQPWPFPSSLMLGFSARWAGGEPAVHDAELEDVGWFTRAAIVGGDVLLPPPTAIARRLIDEWLGDDEAPDAAGGLAVVADELDLLEDEAGRRRLQLGLAARLRRASAWWRRSRPALVVAVVVALVVVALAVVTGPWSSPPWWSPSPLSPPPSSAARAAGAVVVGVVAASSHSISVSASTVPLTSSPLKRWTVSTPPVNETT